MNMRSPSLSTGWKRARVNGREGIWRLNGNRADGDS